MLIWEEVGLLFNVYLAMGASGLRFISILICVSLLDLDLPEVLLLRACVLQLF